MKPLSQNEHKQHTFEYFCKQILKNEKNDYHRELKQQGEREILFRELPPHTIEQFAIWNKYFQDTYLFEIRHDFCHPYVKPTTKKFTYSLKSTFTK